MSHHGHAGHDMGDMQPMCNMNMLFTWDTTNLCLVFKWWQIRGSFSLIVSLLAVVALGAGYELIRELSRRYDSQTDSIALGSRDDISNDRSSLLHSEAGNNNGSNTRNTRMIKALLYAVQVFYSFFIMLLFMTYNGWVMIAVAIGAFAGYLAFAPENASAAKTVACH